MNDICKRLVTAIQSLAPKTEYEEFYKIVEKREKGYEERILRDIQEWNYTRHTICQKDIRKHRKKKQLLRNKRSSRSE